MTDIPFIPNPMYLTPTAVRFECCRCCGIADRDFGVDYDVVRCCPARDQHDVPCALCGQAPPQVVVDP